jgi:uncharacterized Tic20 family protein
MSVPPPINVVADDPEERSMAALSHASILLNLFVPGLGIIAAGAVWLTQSGRSWFAHKQALQATIFQSVWLGLPIVLAIVGVMVAAAGAITASFTDARINIILLPAAIFGVMALAAIFILGLLYALVGAYETYQGRDFRYWIIGKIMH